MKTILALLLLSCVIVLPVPAELTDADLDKIRLIVKEEVKIESEASEKRMKEYIDVRINALDKRLSSRIDMLLVFLIGIIALVAVAIGVSAGQSMKYNSLQKQIDTLLEKLETQ